MGAWQDQRIQNRPSGLFFSLHLPFCCLLLWFHFFLSISGFRCSPIWAGQRRHRLCFTDLRFRHPHIFCHKLQSWVTPCSLYYRRFTDAQGCLSAQLSLLITSGGFIISARLCSKNTEYLTCLFWETSMSFFTQGKPICKYLVLEIRIELQVWSGKTHYCQHDFPALFQEQGNLLSKYCGGICCSTLYYDC